MVEKTNLYYEKLLAFCLEQLQKEEDWEKIDQHILDFLTAVYEQGYDVDLLAIPISVLFNKKMV